MTDPRQSETVLRNFKVATMVGNDVEFKCSISGQPIRKSVQNVDYGGLEDVSIGLADGKIAWIASEEAESNISLNANVIDGGGAVLTPGLIDCHTHLVYGGNRVSEWEMRLNGKSYSEISREGGGILSSVRATRAASEEELFVQASRRLRDLMRQGVTTIEIKSGYGLELKSELKMLRVAKRLGEEYAVNVEPTFLGAHAIPPEFKNRPDDYISEVCDSMIPAAKELCTSVDVFCESIAFDLSQTKRVFEAAKKAGLNIKVHAEQLSSMGAAAMAAEMGALSADHLEYLTPQDCETMAKHGTVATLLPGAFYCLHEQQKPPVAALREFGVPIAIATDCNPGSSPVTSLLLVANMACNLFGLTPAEALIGVTRNAARALGLHESVGTIELGKQADLVIWDAESPAEVIHGLGNNRCNMVFKSGEPTTV